MVLLRTTSYYSFVRSLGNLVVLLRNSTHNSKTFTKLNQIIKQHISMSSTERFGVDTTEVLRLCADVGTEEEVETVVERLFVFFVKNFRSVSVDSKACMATDYAVMKCMYDYMKVDFSSQSKILMACDVTKSVM